MENPKDITSIFTGSQLETNVIIEILKDNDIPVVANDRFNAGLHAGFIDGVAGDVELMVEREDVEKATVLIKEYEKSIS